MLRGRMSFPPLPKIPIPIRNPRDLVDGLRELGGAVADGAAAGSDAVGDFRENVIGKIRVGAGEAAEAFERQLDVLKGVESSWECLTSNFEDFTGTLFAVVDGAKLTCDQAPEGARSRLTATSLRAPLIEGHVAATVTDHKVGSNIFPFAGICKSNGLLCVPEPVPDWVPAAKGLGSGIPLLPSNGQILCRKGGVIAVADPGQQTANVTSEGVPLGPPGVDLKANMLLAALMRMLPMSERLVWFYFHVRPGGPWDYKQRGRQYEDFGNYNYGAAGRELGIPAQILRRMAGLAQQIAGTSEPEYGAPTDVCGNSSFGDDPRDQEMIDAGYDHG